MTHPVRFTRRQALGFGLVVAGVSVAGCQSSSSGGGSGGGSGAQTSINIGTNGDAQNINPILAVDLDGRWRTDLIFDPLVYVDPKTLEAVPNLAQSWEVSPDGRTYTLRLRSGVKFHDGKPFSAKDVEFTVLQILSPGYTGSYQTDWARLAGADKVVDGKAKSLPGLQVVDDTTIKMMLEEPFAGFLPVIARQLKPLPRHLLEGQGDLTTSSKFSLNPIGTGPYKFVRWAKGSAFEAVANDQYWGGAPTMKRITQTIIPDMNTLAAALESGELDASIVPPPSALEQLSSVDTLTIHRLPPLTAEGLVFNLKADRWKDNAKLRQAIAHGIDYLSFAKQFMADPNPTPATFTSPASWAHDQSIVPPKYDLERAKQLLAEAGFPGGKGLTIQLSTNAGNAFRAQEQTYVQEQLAKLGITVKPSQAEWGQFISSIRGARYDVGALNGGDNAGVPDPTALGPVYGSRGAENDSAYSNPKVDQLLAEGAATNDREARKAKYLEVQRILAEDLPFLPGFWRPNSLVVKKSITGVDPSVIGAYWNISRWSGGD